MTRLYLVGGTVRDKLMNLPVGNDIDFAVEADSYDEMLSYVRSLGGDAYLERPEYGSFRGSIPQHAAYERFKGWIAPPPAERKRPDLVSIAADFTLCRVDGFYSDSRHPDSIAPGTIHDDIARRDFTINAIVISDSGGIIDPYLGADDIEHKILRTVGSTHERLNEDPLRMLRAIRFLVTKYVVPTTDLYNALGSAPLIEKLCALPHERIRDELYKMFSFDSHVALRYMNYYPLMTRRIFETTPIWLHPTTRK